MVEGDRLKKERRMTTAYGLVMATAEDGGGCDDDDDDVTSNKLRNDDKVDFSLSDPAEYRLSSTAKSGLLLLVLASSILACLFGYDVLPQKRRSNFIESAVDGVSSVSTNFGGTFDPQLVRIKPEEDGANRLPTNGQPEIKDSGAEDSADRVDDSTTLAIDGADEKSSPKTTTTTTTTDVGNLPPFIENSIIYTSLVGHANGSSLTDVNETTGIFHAITPGKLLPNFVFILADDLGYDSLSEEVSPFLWSLQNDGVKLRNYYTQDVCTPARVALLTGRYPLTVGWQYAEHIVSKSAGLPLSETTMAEVFKRNGYATYMFGKWNLGNLSPRYLPTARGFDHFLGFLNGYTYYWSKLYPYHPTFHDLMYADQMCFYQYDMDDLHHYSTILYRDKAVSAIATHDFAISPMFLYFSSQAVHDPFADNNGIFPDGIDKESMNPLTYDYVHETYQGEKEREYYKALAILDASVARIYEALDAKGVLSNTYFIFASDNGGCPAGGGRNFPLRGTKGSLFEGGVKVEAFVNSPMVPNNVRGTSFTGLFHVTDWFPTLLAMAGIAYQAVDGYELDGMNQFESLFYTSPSPREHVLINYYYNPQTPTATHWTSVPFAVANARYKLMHTYDSPKAAAWYERDSVGSDDDNLLVQGGCAQEVAWEHGEFTRYLFDLENDPTETMNLYDATEQMKVLQQELYAKLEEYTKRAAVPVSETSEASEICFVKWKESGNYIVPWAEAEDVSTLIVEKQNNPAPQNCGFFSKEMESKIPSFMLM